jgi:pyrimidine-specific ribonucleoside hydrolase
MMIRLVLAAGVVLAFAGTAAECGLADEPGSDDVSALPGKRPLAVLKRFPLDPAWYKPEAAELLRKGILEKYGQEEWAAVVLTHEFHQHTGIYNVLGAKMGVRAGEILKAPTRAVHVTAETGVEPPISCAVDGLQVSLGSTLAQKLIDVPEVPNPCVAAAFEYEGSKVRLSLKPEYQEKVESIIKAAVEKHGRLTPAYFHEVEDRCFDIWFEFDRREIFLEEHLPAGASTRRE